VNWSQPALHSLICSKGRLILLSRCQGSRAKPGGVSTAPEVKACTFPLQLGLGVCRPVKCAFAPPHEAPRSPATTSPPEDFGKAPA
jgi:hypothetical protein